MSPAVHVAVQAEVAPVPAGASTVEAARFVVGQDPTGHWVAIEIHGRAGGLFRSRKDAIAYAEDETGHRPDAVLLSATRVALRL